MSVSKKLPEEQAKTYEGRKVFAVVGLEFLVTYIIYVALQFSVNAAGTAVSDMLTGYSRRPFLLDFFDFVTTCPQAWADCIYTAAYEVFIMLALQSMIFLPVYFVAVLFFFPKMMRFRHQRLRFAGRTDTGIPASAFLPVAIYATSLSQAPLLIVFLLGASLKAHSLLPAYLYVSIAFLAYVPKKTFSDFKLGIHDISGKSAKTFLMTVYVLTGIVAICLFVIFPPVLDIPIFLEFLEQMENLYSLLIFSFCLFTIPFILAVMAAPAVVTRLTGMSLTRASGLTPYMPDRMYATVQPGKSLLNS